MHAAGGLHAVRPSCRRCCTCTHSLDTTCTCTHCKSTQSIAHHAPTNTFQCLHTHEVAYLGSCSCRKQRSPSNGRLLVRAELTLVRSGILIPPSSSLLFLLLTEQCLIAHATKVNSSVKWNFNLPLTLPPLPPLVHPCSRFGIPKFFARTFGARGYVCEFF